MVRAREGGKQGVLQLMKKSLQLGPHVYVEKERSFGDYDRTLSRQTNKPKLKGQTDGELTLLAATPLMNTKVAPRTFLILLEVGAVGRPLQLVVVVQGHRPLAAAGVQSPPQGAAVVDHPGEGVEVQHRPLVEEVAEAHHRAAAAVADHLLGVEAGEGLRPLPAVGAGVDPLRRLIPQPLLFPLLPLLLR
jgi:hypothetical protein